MKAKIAIAIFSLLITSIVNAEITSCQEVIKKTFVDDKNRLYAFLVKRNSYVSLCNLSEPYCQKWDRLLDKVAGKRKKVIIKYRNLETSCLDIPEYDRGAPTPFYIMAKHPKTYQDPIFDLPLFK
jgi:hypothetical protein